MNVRITQLLFTEPTYLDHLSILSFGEMHEDIVFKEQELRK
jgi:hypothetical protein